MSIVAFTVLFAASISRGKAQSKFSSLPENQQRLLLKLSSRYLFVWSETQLDLDTCLYLAAGHLNLSPELVINEGLPSGSPQEQELANLVHRGAWCVFQPKHDNPSLDSAGFYLSTAIAKGNAAHSLVWPDRAICLLAKYYFKKNQPAQGVACLDSAIARARVRGDRQLEAYALDMEGTYGPMISSVLPLKLNADKQAAQLFEQLKDTTEAIAVWTNYAYMSFLFSQINNAIDAFDHARLLEKAIQFPFTHYTNDGLSLCYSITGNYGEEIRDAQAAVQSANATGDDLGLALFYSRVADLRYGPHWKTQNWDFYQKSLAQYQKSIIYNRMYQVLSRIYSNDYKNHHPSPKAALDSVQDYVKRFPPISALDLQDCDIALGDVYTAIQNYSKAETYYLAALKTIHDHPMLLDQKHIVAVYNSLGILYYQMEQYDKSRSYFALFQQTGSGNSHSIDNLRDVEKILYRMDSTEGKQASALSHLQKYVAYADQLNEEQQSELVEDLQTHYQTTEKEKDIQRLKAEQETRQKQETLARNIAILFLLLLLSIITLLWNRYYIKKKQKETLDQTNNLLSQTLQEKDELIKSREWLLKEVHHRVKNNLHTIICLLESQADNLKGDALKALQDSERRIYAMSLIHQKLYQTENIQSIAMVPYLDELITYLRDSFGSKDHIVFHVQSDPISLDISQAIPIALIINEAVTNSMKYAFEGRTSGQINISIQQQADTIRLKIADNGIGFTLDSNIVEKPSLGLQLMQGLSDDLEGILTIEMDGGAIVTLQFKKENLNQPNGVRSSYLHI